MNENEASIQEKLQKVNYGLEFLDDRIREEPNNLVLRNIRAYVCLKIPSNFNRISTAINDLEYLKKIYEVQLDERMARNYNRVVADLEKAYALQNTAANE